MTRIRRILKSERLKKINRKYMDPKLIQSYKAYLKDPKKNLIKTMSRSSTITSQFDGLEINVYNGKRYVPVLVTPDNVGFKYGEFVFTRKFLGHKKDGKKLMFKKKEVTNKIPFKYIKPNLNPINLGEHKKILQKMCRKKPYLRKPSRKNAFRKKKAFKPFKPFTDISVFKNLINNEKKS